MSLTSFLSFATSAPNNMGLVRNELQHVDLPTGKRPLKSHYSVINAILTRITSVPTAPKPHSRVRSHGLCVGQVSVQTLQ